MSPRLLRFDTFDVGLFCCEQAWLSHGTMPETISCRRPLNLPDDWLRTLERYSYRRATNSSDKLLALSSIAAFVQPTINNQYLAGLWKSDLARWLCWFAFGALHPADRNTPSWSRMAVTGVVKYPLFDDNFIPSFEIIDAQTNLLADKVLFG